MNRTDLIEEIKKQPFWYEKLLDPKENHTTKKVELLHTYMNLYIQVQANRHNQIIQNIDFIDAMSNAGIYQDGDLCTSMEVLNVFLENTEKYPNIEFTLFVNDINEKRIACTEWLYQKLTKEIDSEKLKHIHIKYSCMDVNEYLSYGTQIPKSSFNRAQVIWLDPYNFGTIKIDSVLRLLKNRYCELFYNVFTSDFKRNYITGNIPADKLDIDIDFISNNEILMKWIQEVLKSSSNIEYCFSYSFNNFKNVELYKILFATPNIAGLKKFKEALSRVFENHPLHSNCIPYSDVQPSLFGDEEKKMYAEEAGRQAAEIFFKEFRNTEMSYKEIEEFLLESTMLTDTQIINYFIKPLIRERRIEKENKAGTRNYKEDYYMIKA